MPTMDGRREHMLELARRWRDSGVSARTFAQDHGVTAWTLYYWQQRLAGVAARPRRRRSARPALAPVHVVADPVPRADGLEIVLANGDRLRASADVPAETLGRALQALRARC